MRHALKPHTGKRITVHAHFTRYGLRGRRRRQRLTALLSDVQTPDGQPLADHLWLKAARPLNIAGIRPGAHISLTGRVVAYNTRTGSTNYNIVDVDNVEKITIDLA